MKINAGTLQDYLVATVENAQDQRSKRLQCILRGRPNAGGNALSALFKGHTRFALVMDQSQAIHGVVAKAHRRY